MHSGGRLSTNRTSHQRTGAQALVELALVMPLLFGIVTVLFQLGIIFIGYLAVVHETRDVARWLAVHPDSDDSQVLAHIDGNLPSVINPTPVRLSTSPAVPGDLAVTLTPGCPTKTNGRCPNRTLGSPQLVSMQYDFARNLFLPADFRFGPFLRAKIPTSLPGYDYTVMIEPA